MFSSPIWGNQVSICWLVPPSKIELCSATVARVFATPLTSHVANQTRCVRAVKEIQPGEEITVDYGFFDEFPPWWVGEAAEAQPSAKATLSPVNQSSGDARASASTESGAAELARKRKAIPLPPLEQGATKNRC